ncbi:MAG TPA: SCO family protein [Beijerinckiaceae bacterium]|jgi:protein SCO1/2|nr:SCO family protein [Beijerinckiaceae bacterium]
MMLSDRVRRLAVPLIAFTIGLAVLATAAVLTLTPSREQGVAAVGGPFALVDHNGRTVTERDFAGKPFLVFFGFTRCPDVCPTTLFQISEILAATGPRGKPLRALFVTVDPERDTPESLKSYLSSFDDRIVGLTGSPEAVAAMEKVYRAYARKVPLKDGDYTMEHTGVVYLMDGKGRFVRPFKVDREPAAAAMDLLKVS